MIETKTPQDLISHISNHASRVDYVERREKKERGKAKNASADLISHPQRPHNLIIKRESFYMLVCFI